MTDAVSRYADDVRNGTYPSEAESYALPAETAAEMDIEIPSRDSKAESPKPTSNYGDHQSPPAHEFRRAKSVVNRIRLWDWFRRWARHEGHLSLVREATNVRRGGGIGFRESDAVWSR